MKGILKIYTDNKALAFKYVMECDIVVAESGNNITVSADATLLGTNEQFSISVSRNSIALKRWASENADFVSMISKTHTIQIMCLGETRSTEVLEIELQGQSLVLMQKNTTIELNQNSFTVQSRAYFKKANARTDRFNIIITAKAAN